MIFVKQFRDYPIKKFPEVYGKVISEKLWPGKTDDEKEEHPFSSINTSTETRFFRCNRCCEKIRIRSSNLAAELHPHLLGIYSQVIDATIDCSHPPIYKLALM